MGRLEELTYTATENLVNGNIKEAIRDYNLALVIDSNNLLVLEGLGFAHRIGGQPDQAERFYKYALEIDPNNKKTRNELAEIYLKQEKFNEASEEQIKILKEDSKDIRARVGLGRSYQGMKKYDDAIREYSDVVKDGLKATVNLGWKYLFSRKRYDRIGQIAQRRIEECDISLAYIGLVRIHCEKGELSQAIKYISQWELFKFKSRVMNFFRLLSP